MSADIEAVRTVMSWACGFLTIAIFGIAVPVLLSFLPDALHHWRRRGEMRPALIACGLVAVLCILGWYELTFTGIPGTPHTVLWISLGLLLFVGVGIAALFSSVVRAVRRRREHRAALEVATAPPTATSAWGGSGKPGALKHLNARGAEFLARDWMRYLGADDAIETPEQRDGGVDVRSREFVAQVKHVRDEQIGVVAVRQLYGVATAEGRRALFFSSSGYTRDALAFARENDIALFVVRFQEGRLVPHGALAQHYLSAGLHVTARVR